MGQREKEFKGCAQRKNCHCHIALFMEKGIAATSMDEFFKTAGMKPIGKIVCESTSNKKEAPEQIIKKIERCLE